MVYLFHSVSQLLHQWDNFACQLDRGLGTIGHGLGLPCPLFGHDHLQVGGSSQRLARAVVGHEIKNHVTTADSEDAVLVVDSGFVGKSFDRIEVSSA